MHWRTKSNRGKESCHNSNVYPVWEQNCNYLCKITAEIRIVVVNVMLLCLCELFFVERTFPSNGVFWIDNGFAESECYRWWWHLKDSYSSIADLCFVSWSMWFYKQICQAYNRRRLDVNLNPSRLSKSIRTLETPANGEHDVCIPYKQGLAKQTLLSDGFPTWNRILSTKFVDFNLDLKTYEGYMIIHICKWSTRSFNISMYVCSLS